MTLREMEIFLAVTEHKTMRKAAETLYVSQPSISGAIATIEQELGVKLFERLGKKLYITSAGENLARYATEILNLHTELLQSVQTDENLRLRIGATISVGGQLLCSILKEWHAPQPFVQVTNTAEIEHKLLHAELDCAIIEGNIHTPDLYSIPMFFDQMYIFCATDHPFAQHKQVPLRALCQQPLILREEGSGTRETTLAILKEHGIPHTVLWQSNSIEAIYEAVKNGFGITIASDKIFPQYKNICKVAIADCDFSRRFHFVYHKNKFINPTFAAFIALCKQMSDL